MMHPATESRFINEQIGFGVFARQDIPKGTIVYVKDDLEISIDPVSLLSLDERYRALVDKYSYIESDGNHVVSWDIAKYVNHHCDSNTLSSGYGFEIAVCDISEGEEITDDYGMFNMIYSMPCHCGSNACRAQITGSDPANMSGQWDTRVREALADLYSVDQPLLEYLDTHARKALNSYLATGRGYRSVAELQWLFSEVG